MGLKIALPTADLIGVAGATTSVIDSTTVQLTANTIYVTGTAEAATLSVSIPATANDGDVILIKNLGEGDVNILSASNVLIDGIVQSVEITNNQPVRLVYHSASIGWIIA